MSLENIQQEQDQNTAKLVMSAFYKVADKDGATASEITRYLQDKFGDVWRPNTLTSKAEDTLKRSAGLGFLDRQGDRYIVNLTREMGCCCKRKKRRRRPPSCCCPPPKKKKRCPPRKRRRPSCCCNS